MNITKIIFIFAAAIALPVTLPLRAHDGKEHAKGDAAAKPQDVTIKGEVLDLGCYIDHGASGPKHADCAQECIESGIPVGLLGEDGKIYLLLGEHKPMNKELAPFAGKKITLKGKLVSRGGVNMIENAAMVK